MDALGRPDWDSYLLGLAFVAARRSPDPSTKHGALVVDRFRHVIGLGFNGYPAGVDDASMPRLGLDEAGAYYDSKRAWVDHAEVNAIANMTVATSQAAGPLICYVTGEPCFACAKALARHGILRWVVADRHGNAHPEPGEAAATARLVRDRGVLISRVRPDLGWLLGGDFVAAVRAVTRSEEP